MKTLVSTLLAIGLVVPVSVTYALSLDEIIEAAKAGSGTYTESHSSASTGGQTVRSGETISTDNTNASSHVQTVITSTQAGGSVHVQIETSKNGTTETNEYTAPITAGAGVTVESNAVVTPDDAKTEVRVDGAPLAPNTNDADGETASASMGLSSDITAFFARVPTLFKKVWEFFF